MACKAIGDQVPAITPVSAPFPPPLLKHWAAFSWASLLSASGFLHMLFLLFFGWDTAASYFGSQFKWHGIKVGIPRLHLGNLLEYRFWFSNSGWGLGLCISKMLWVIQGLKIHTLISRPWFLWRKWKNASYHLSSSHKRVENWLTCDEQRKNAKNVLLFCLVLH